MRKYKEDIKEKYEEAKKIFEKSQGKNRKRKTKGDISVEKIQNWIWGSPNIILKWS